MAADFTRRVMLGAIPALGLTMPAWAQPPAPPTGSRLGIPVEDDITSTLDAWVDRYGRPTAKVMLNGLGPFEFLVDTGSTTTVLAERLVTLIGAQIVGEATVAGTTGMAVTPVAQIKSIVAGVVEKRDVQVAILPDGGLSRADGILGADVFAGKRLSFNIQDKVVRIEIPRRTRNAPPSNMRIRNGLLAEIWGSVGNVKAKLMLDTGAQNCIVNLPLSEALRKVHPRLTRVEKVQVVGVTGHVIVGEFIALPRVDMKAFSVKDAGAIAADASIFKLWELDQEPAMIVGVNLLSRLDSFSIDYGTKVFDATLMSNLVARNSVAFG